MGKYWDLTLPQKRALVVLGHYLLKVHAGPNPEDAADGIPARDLLPEEPSRSRVTQQVALVLSRLSRRRPPLIRMTMASKGHSSPTTYNLTSTGWDFYNRFCGELHLDQAAERMSCGACVHRCSTCGLPHDGDPNHWRGDRHMVADPGAGFAGCAVADLVECGAVGAGAKMTACNKGGTRNESKT
jgi:hypothetical protein